MKPNNKQNKNKEPQPTPPPLQQMVKLTWLLSLQEKVFLIMLFIL